MTISEILFFVSDRWVSITLCVFMLCDPVPFVDVCHETAVLNRALLYQSGCIPRCHLAREYEPAAK